MTTNTIGPFVGIDNRLPDYALTKTERGKKTGDHLRNAVNVDLTRVGSLRRREGYTLDVEGGTPHSLWSDGQTAYYVDGPTLYQYPRTAVKTGMNPQLPVSYVKTPTGRVCWSNGAESGFIVGGQNYPVSVPLPNPVPTVSVSEGGSLPAGLYQISFANINALIERSGTTPVIQVEVPDNGRIQITGVTNLTVVYMSPQNGDLLYEVGVASAPLTIAVMPELHSQALNVDLRPIPAGHSIRWFAQRLLVADGSTLYFSEAAAPGLYNPSKGYIPFPSRITIVEPMDGGVWVVADKTYWLEGRDIEQAVVTERLPYGAAEGSATHDPRSKQTWWYSNRGLVMANDEGVVNVQEQNIAPVRVEQGASLFREQDGLRQIIAATMRQDTSVAQANSYMTMEVIRKGDMQ